MLVLVLLVLLALASATPGQAWVEKPVPPRGGAAVYDTGRNRVVLLGGASGETWEWDGRSWTRRLTANGPSGRTDVALAYDGLRRRVILFGRARRRHQATHG